MSSSSQNGPIHDIAHIGHAELLTPTPDETLRFFVDVLGMDEEAREGNSVFLRGVWDYERYCLKITESDAPGLAHLALRAESPAALERRVAAIERAGLGIGWTDGDVGHGPAYRFTDPDGHVFEVYYETERYAPTEEEQPLMRNQPQRHRGRGVGVHRLEHVNFFASDVRPCREFMERELGYRVRELITLGDGTEFGVWMSVSIQGHEIIYVRETLPGRGRLHHLAFWVGSREDVLRAADLIQDSGIFIEAGPAKHTPLHSFYLYVWEPGGNRIEVTSGGYFVFDPDAVATRWTGAEYADAKPWDRSSWGRSFPTTFDTYGTPPIESPVETSATPASS